MIQLSIIIITKNEAENIEDCLESVNWADEIIVVDSGSTDNTVALCQKFTDKIFVYEDWQGFGIQKQRALSHAQGQWIFSIDADERVTTGLRHEILTVLATAISTDSLVYAVPRISSYCGRFIHHSGWHPDYVYRLFKRHKAQFSKDIVHERLLFNAPSEKLLAPLLHYSYRRLEDVLDKVNIYSSAGAQRYYQQGKKGSLFKAISHGLWNFFYTYVVRLGFLDGKEGLMLAISNAEGTYYRYLKLMYLLKQNAEKITKLP